MNIRLLNQCLLLPALLLLPLTAVRGQQYYTETGTAAFEVQAPAKTIKGISEAVSIRIDLKQGTVALHVPVRSFRFHNNFISDTLNKVIYDRFNSHYMESDRFPLVVYTGNMESTQPGGSGNKSISTFHSSGTLLVHGQEKKVFVSGTLDRSSGQTIVRTDIVIKPADWGVRIPTYIGDMYFREVKIEVNGTLKNAGKFPKAK